jgi:hypothetical protein
LAGLTVVLAASAARAQVGRQPNAGEGKVAAAGRVHLQRQPTHLRMFVQLTGKGKTLEEALAALKERREAVVAELEKLGAEKGAEVCAPPSVDESAGAQQRRMEMMIAQRLGRGAKKAAKPVKPPVAVTALLTAQWPLAGDTPEKLLLAADAVREKVKTADLSGDKESPKLSPEEQEVAEEMAAQPNQGGDEEQAKPGEPHFMFVAKLSPQDRQAALADAFAKAKTQAGELAKAAGAGLGPLTGLSGEGGGGMSGVNPYRYNNYNRQAYAEFLQQVAENAGGEEQQGEALAPRPDGIGFDFAVNAEFALETAKPQK